MEIFLHKQSLDTWGFARTENPALKVCPHLIRIVNLLSSNFVKMSQTKMGKMIFLPLFL